MVRVDGGTVVTGRHRNLSALPCLLEGASPARAYSDQAPCRLAAGAYRVITENVHTLVS